ncbi:hypothetical protein, partial [Pseudomonas mandelii]|uniref:hypothetical protein n=1 Tax=Pseudomonas mandelii TaxID=75612 RepID=UPI001C3D3DAF
MNSFFFYNHHNVGSLAIWPPDHFHKGLDLDQAMVKRVVPFLTMDGVVFCRVTGCLIGLAISSNTLPVGASLLWRGGLPPFRPSNRRK